MAGWTAAPAVAQLLLLPIPLPADLAVPVVVHTVAAHVAGRGIRVAVLVAGVGGAVAAGFRWSTPPGYRTNAIERERLAAAREIHDVVAHTLAVVIVQADGGRVADQPPPATAPIEAFVVGRGIAGMRERVAELGGTFAAGPHGNGFRVEVTLP